MSERYIHLSFQKRQIVVGEFFDVYVEGHILASAISKVGVLKIFNGRNKRLLFLCLYVPSKNTYGTIYIPKSYEVAKTMLEDILFFVVAFISEIIGAIAGFGSSTIFLPLALFFVDFKTALILVAISHLFGNLGRINFFRHGLDIKIIITFGIPSILLSFVGASIVGILSQDILKVILGIFLIVISILFLLRSALKFPTNTSTVITGGSVSGLITGLLGTGGALRATFLTGFNLEKAKYIATAAVIALATDATRIPSYLSQGFLLEQYYYYIPFLLATAIGGSFIGRKIVDKIDQQVFRKIVLVSIILVSINFIVDGVKS